MKRGFTLLEVMLALAIFALAATAVLQIASGALSNQQILELLEKQYKYSFYCFLHL